MDALLISLVSAATALVASIIGPVVTLSVAKRQFNATVLSANRQKWIETLRDAVAGLVSLLVTAMVVKSRWEQNWNRGRAALTDPALMEKLQQMVQTQFRIRLLLNPTEPDHVRLQQAIDAALKRLRSEESSDADMEADIETITSLTQAILKREWQRVKQGT
jgi:hypothetical protein